MAWIDEAVVQCLPGQLPVGSPLPSVGVEHPCTHDLVMLVELLRQNRLTLPSVAAGCGQLMPYGALLRYGDLPDDEHPSFNLEVAERTLIWASGYLEKRS